MLIKIRARENCTSLKCFIIIIFYSRNLSLRDLKMRLNCHVILTVIFLSLQDLGNVCDEGYNEKYIQLVIMQANSLWVIYLMLFFRNCIGQNFALNEQKVLIGSLVKR